MHKTTKWLLRTNRYWNFTIICTSLSRLMQYSIKPTLFILFLHKLVNQVNFCTQKHRFISKILLNTTVFIRTVSKDVKVSMWFEWNYVLMSLKLHVCIIMTVLWHKGYKLVKSWRTSFIYFYEKPCKIPLKGPRKTV